MAFDIRNLSEVRALGGNKWHWNYRTTDSLATCLGANYFSTVNGLSRLHAGDVLDIVASSDAESQQVTISSVAGGSVVLLQSSAGAATDSTARASAAAAQATATAAIPNTAAALAASLGGALLLSTGVTALSTALVDPTVSDAVFDSIGVVHVNKFGADGGGSVDDGPAIQAASDSASVVASSDNTLSLNRALIVQFDTSKIYAIRSPVSIQRDGVHWVGAGPSSARIRLKDTGQIIIGTNDPTTAANCINPKHCSIKRINIINTTDHTVSPLVDVQMADNLVIEDVNILSFNTTAPVTALRMNADQWCRLSRVYLGGTGTVLHLDSTSKVSWEAHLSVRDAVIVLGNYQAGVTNAAIRLEQSTAASGNNYSRVNTRFENVHCGFYPNNADYTQQTYGVYAFSAAGGPDRFAWNGGAFENFKTMVSFNIDGYSAWRDIAFYGNASGRTTDGFAADGSHGHYLLDSLTFNIMTNAINCGGHKTIVGEHKIVTVTTYLTTTSNVRFFGHVTGLSSSKQIMTRGTATITSGSTSVTVTHNGYATPTVDQLTIIPGVLGTAVKWWVSTIGSTTFAINIDQVAGADVVFGWRMHLGDF